MEEWWTANDEAGDDDEQQKGRHLNKPSITSFIILISPTNERLSDNSLIKYINSFSDGVLCFVIVFVCGVFSANIWYIYYYPFEVRHTKDEWHEAGVTIGGVIFL